MKLTVVFSASQARSEGGTPVPLRVLQRAGGRRCQEEEEEEEEDSTKSIRRGGGGVMKKCFMGFRVH